MDKEYDDRRWRIRWYDNEGGAGTETGVYCTADAEAWVDYLNKDWPNRTYEKYEVPGYSTRKE